MKKTIGYVLSHTHWDREWYLSFQLFRMRLVDMLDTLIPYLEQHPEFPHFHLDGQTVCLEDYLEVRPDQAERLRHLIEAGRIAVGPWYVLPDLQCIGQEPILRNLSRGLALAQRFGVGTPVGYLPDIFSHPAQLPQIFAGYGFRAAVIWRGSSDDPEPPYEVLWRAPDGTQLLTLRLPDDRGYLNAFPLADTPEAVSRQFEDWFHERLPRSPSGQLLFMNGCDHQTPNYALPEFIRYFNETHDDYELRQISLTQYLDELHITPGELTVLCGEQNRTNYSAGRHLNPTLKNTLSTHIPQKIENAQCEAGRAILRSSTSRRPCAGLPRRQTRSRPLRMKFRCSCSIFPRGQRKTLYRRLHCGCRQIRCFAALLSEQQTDRTFPVRSSACEKTA